MKKYSLILLSLLMPALAAASAWDTEYRVIEAKIVEPQFADRAFDITKYGASTQATAAQNQKAITAAIAACAKAGGGRVVVPAGTYTTGAIRLESGVNLVVEKDATLLFAFEPELYPLVPTRWEGLDCTNLSPCIYAYKAKNVGLTGEGTVDGGATNDTWWKWSGKKHYGWKEGEPRQQDDHARPRLLRMAEDGVPPRNECSPPRTSSALSSLTSISARGCS